MSFLSKIFGEKKQREALQPLYRAIVARAREPYWYREGAVPDTIDGRFDMIASVLALVLLRIERDEDKRGLTAVLTEAFVADMDVSLREIGIGDYVVGKHVGRMMSALGGRLGALREGDLDAAVRRNIFHDAPPSDDAVAQVAERLADLRDGLAAMDTDDLLAGKLP